MFIRPLTLALLALAAAANARAAEAARQPNIVFVLVDDLRWDDLGCTGNEFVETPNIDRISREGMQFYNAFCTTPICSPSRASILTGQYAHTHGIIDNLDRSAASHRLKTFPQELQRAGYETAYIGKWHMGNDNTERPGFDRWFCLKGQGTSFDSLANDDGRDVQTKGYVTDILNEKSLEFIRQPHDRPFMLYLAHKALHPETAQGADGKLTDPTASNYIPAPRHAKQYEGVEIKRRPSAGVPPLDKPALQQEIAGLPPLGPETGTTDTGVLNRLRMLSAIDEGVGQIVKALEDAGQLDDTVLVVTSDHGYFYGEHGLSVERRLAYEETIRIPLLVRYPALVEAGSTADAMVQTIDFAPTLVELAGAAIPSAYQGRSLVPLLKGETPADWRESILVEYWSDTVFPRMQKLGYQAARNDRWKYIHYTDQPGMDELYDLQSDPYEMKNLIGDPAAADSLATMQTELERLLIETDGK